MPTQWTLELAAEPQRPLARQFDVLHAIACSIFERPSDNHDADNKAFAVRTGAGTGEHGTRTIVLTWLDDRHVPAVRPPDPILVGNEKIPLAGVKQTAYGYDQVEAVRPTTQLAFTMSTPTLFRHNGHNYPLPDPYVIFASLARRYRTYRPQTGPTDELIRELGRATMVLRHRLRTEQFSWHSHVDSGFTGEVEFRLEAAVTNQTRHTFTTLGTFAAIAGLGRGTTHGLGATTVNPPSASVTSGSRLHAL